MYGITSQTKDSRGVDVVIITCMDCGYFEQHFKDRGAKKAGTKCDQCGR